MKCFCLSAFLSTVLLISGCHKNINKSADGVKSAQLSARQQRIHQTFSALTVNGDIDVVIKPLKRGSKLILEGAAKDLVSVTTHYKEGQVIVSAVTVGTRHKPIKAIVYTSQLNTLKFVGNGNITGQGLHGSLMRLDLVINGRVTLSGHLDLRRLSVAGNNKVLLKNVRSRNLWVDLKDRPDVKIEGMVNLRRLHYSGSGRLAIHWLNSSDLVVEGRGTAKVYLAGVARYLHATVGGQAELDARYLRIQKSYIKARDYATVRLVPMKELNAFASDHGHIYYYHSPKFKAEYMAENGAILNFVRYK